MKSDVIFLCTECKKRLPKWMGRCPGCGAWNTVVQQAARPAGGKLFHARHAGDEDQSGPRPVTEITLEDAGRIHTGIGELDRVLGGGLTPGSMALVGGDPGIGKSTLIMTALARIAGQGESVLYISGEESAQQLAMRAERMGIRTPSLLVYVENEIETILEQISVSNARVIALDSAQSVYSKAIESQAGGPAQVRHAAAKLMETVKGKDCACFLVGHVTKDGALAGPKVLEHMVDTVLSFEGDHTHAYRILRSVKNRFGASGEIGVFEMNEAGLHEVTNPSAYFISERHEEASGSAVTALMEGTRPILTEIQALVSGPVPGQGRRTAIGFDHGRLALLIAVIEKKLGFALGDHDVFLNAVGGMRVREPAADLAAMAALLSSILDRPTPAGALVLGEVGLTGEVRRISHVAARCNEAARIGFRRLIAPKNSLEGLKQSDMETLPVSNISELIPTLFGL